MNSSDESKHLILPRGNTVVIAGTNDLSFNKHRHKKGATLDGIGGWIL